MAMPQAHPGVLGQTRVPKDLDSSPSSQPRLRNLPELTLMRTRSAGLARRHLGPAISSQAPPKALSPGGVDAKRASSRIIRSSKGELVLARQPADAATPLYHRSSGRAEVGAQGFPRVRLDVINDSLGGVSGSYLVKNDAGKRFVFKPNAEEPYRDTSSDGGTPERSPARRRAPLSERKVPKKVGVEYGQTAVKEFAAHLLDHGGWAGVPRSVLVGGELGREVAGDDGPDDDITHLSPALSKLSVAKDANRNSGLLSPPAPPISPSITPISPDVTPLSPSITQLTPAPALPPPLFDEAPDTATRASPRAEHNTAVARSTAVSKYVPPNRRKTAELEQQRRAQEDGEEVDAKVKSGAVVPSTSGGGGGKYVPPWKRKLLAAGSFGDPVLLRGETMLPKLKPRRRYLPAAFGSLQEFIPNIGSADDVGSSFFRVEDVHRIGVLDIRLCNLDRHLGNILVTEREGKVRRLMGSERRRGGRGRPEYKLVPIDHAYILPDFRQLADVNFEWLYWKQAAVPFSRETLDYIESLDPFADASKLKRLGLADASALTLVITTLFLQHCARRGMTLYEIGRMIQRPGFGKTRSVLEKIIEHAMLVFRTHTDRALTLLGDAHDDDPRHRINSAHDLRWSRAINVLLQLIEGQIRTVVGGVDDARVAAKSDPATQSSETDSDMKRTESGETVD